MFSQQILEKAFIKAIKQGWKIDERFTPHDYVVGMEKEPSEWPSINDIIFNHDFAKALWGNGEANGMVDNTATSPSTAKPLIPLWKYRLQEMVIAENPIKYLGENT